MTVIHLIYKQICLTLFTSEHMEIEVDSVLLLNKHLAAYLFIIDFRNKYLCYEKLGQFSIKTKKITRFSGN